MVFFHPPHKSPSAIPVCPRSLPPQPRICPMSRRSSSSSSSPTAPLMGAFSRRESDAAAWVIFFLRSAGSKLPAKILRASVRAATRIIFVPTSHSSLSFLARRRGSVGRSLAGSARVETFEDFFERNKEEELRRSFAHCTRSPPQTWAISTGDLQLCAHVR